MNNFPIIATILSMILGLSATRLLAGAVTVFRIRRTAKPDWVPLLWALIIFTIELEYWWAISSLPKIRSTYSFGDFLLLVVVTLSLFLSAALALPSRSEDEKYGLRMYFEQDGRYSLLALSMYLFFGVIVNIRFFHSSPISLWGIMDVAMFSLPVIAFFSTSRKIYAAIAIIYFPLTAFDLAVALFS